MLKDDKTGRYTLIAIRQRNGLSTINANHIKISSVQRYFHPSYAQAFKFSLAGEDVIAGRTLEKISFEHIPGMKSPAALALRGREYPLELQGIAWIEPESGSIAKIEAGIADTLQDVGLKTLISEIDFAPLTFSDSKVTYWFPTQARVEVETPKQHWRNLHQFSSYKKFSVNTEDKVIQK